MATRDPRSALARVAFLALLASPGGAAQPLAAAEGGLRPPAVPLVACDPYFSIWSRGSRLTDVPTTHWTGRPHRLTSIVRIDGRAHRLMGAEPASLPLLDQKSLQVLPTRTIYDLEGAGVRLTLSFTTPALPDDLDLLSRPVTYLTWEARSVDGAEHAVSVYFDVTSEPVVDDPDQEVVWDRVESDGAVTLRFGSRAQPILQKRGDDRRIDWGHLYAILPRGGLAAGAIVGLEGREAFIATGGLVAGAAPEMPRAARDAPVAAAVYDLGKVAAAPSSAWLALAYDDIYSIQYFRENLRPYWRRSGADGGALVAAALRDRDDSLRRCAAFDEELLADLRRVGGEEYARLAALSYRQALAGNKLAADANGQPLLFPKENTSNGCIGTVDVIYPMAPLYLLFGSSLAKAMIVSNLDYASSPRWRFPFAPHDLGTYPKANAQVYGGGERSEENQMPVEETGNMLILVAAVAKLEGNADFAGLYWPLLLRWAEYLEEKGFDPENQLCTDDFMGHLAHNTNLSLKATMGLASFGYLCELRGEKELAERFGGLARSFARRWVEEADDGDHFRLAFDKPGTWSQKYNLVWDRILGFGLFPDAVLRKEMDFYLRSQRPFGLPLDSRGSGAKLDWTLWTATLTRDPADFRALVSRVYRFADETPQRVGLGDFYDTSNGHLIAMHSRPVVGGVFLELLYHPELWRKWASRERVRAAGWAPLPRPPRIVTVVASSEVEGQPWRYTTEPPAEGWQAPGFDDGAWREGKGGFGTRETPGVSVGTVWSSSEIWLRREFELPEGSVEGLRLRLHHDEDAEVFINGVAAARLEGFTTSYEEIELAAEARAALRPGANLFAVHCRQTRGGQYIDVGLARVEPAAVAGPGATERPVRALLVTGGCCHDYGFQARALQEAPLGKGRIEWTVVEEGGTGTRGEIALYDDPKWAEGHDVVVHNECFADTDDPEYIRKITSVHREGVPAVVIHCAMHTYRAARIDDWRELLGVTSRRHEHQSRYPVVPVERSHPILEGFPERWTSPMDELYVVEKLWPNAKALAVSKSERTGEEHPTFWINRYGEGRVFGTTFGHSRETFADPVFIETVIRGLLWAAGTGRAETGRSP